MRFDSAHAIEIAAQLRLAADAVREAATLPIGPRRDKAITDALLHAVNIAEAGLEHVGAMGTVTDGGLNSTGKPVRLQGARVYVRHED